ncbi:MAG TPA: FAD-dependent oxidoreductase [Thermoanaerobaculia bacterium]|nr:FAD-dependent oxidoreductase [Thermoanaerobaculia bacterium]
MQTELTGPDLEQGISLDELPDGAMLGGHAGGEAVLLVRRGNEIYAIGGTCTHYSAPLAEGLVVGNTVRCPWHHACFDLRTGEAVRAPALSAVPVWNVERRAGKVFVTGKGDAPKPRPLPPPPETIGIIGAGAAGAAACEMLRKSGYTGAIAMMGAEETLPVDRPNLSKDYLAGNAPEEWIPLRSSEFYSEQNIEVITGHRVLQLEPSTKTVTLDNGVRRSFDAILLATGADPIRLTPPGAERVHVLRTLKDSRTIIAEAEKGKKALVLGASFIGLEVAAALRARECDVTVVAPEDVPLAKPMGAELGTFIRRLHESHGVRFRLGTTASKFETNRVILANGEPVDADFVVAGVGVRPNTMLAQLARLRVENGVVVDERMQTSAPGIFAAGDIALYPDHYSGRMMRVEHWAVAEQQGQTAARNMVGIDTPHVAPPFFWSAHYDVTINMVGSSVGFTRSEVRGSLDERRALVAYYLGDDVISVATIGLDREALAIEAAMEKGDKAEVKRIIASV